MNRTHALGFISLFILGAGTAFVACSSDSGGGTPGVTPDTGVKDTAVSDTNTPQDTAGGDTATGDTNTPSDTGSETGGLCSGTPTDGTIKSFNFPSQLSKNTLVHATTIVALSPKFLVSFSKTSGSCLYGFFATDPQTTFGEYSGSLIISYGNKGTVGGSSSTCSEGDSIPSGVKAGDQFELTGTYSAYAPTTTSCTTAPNASKIPEIQVCNLTAKAAGTVPAPAAVTEANLSGATTNADLPKWVAGWVKLSNVTAGAAVTGDAGVTLSDGGPAASDKFGTFTTSGGVAVGDKLYFKTDGTPVVGPGQSFTSIQGIPYLDFCTWTLWPTHLTDISPTPSTASTGDAATGG